ncbi:protein ANTI-SILENCING 1-like isoform X1 [Iris pallida]|uniref:Protein ANTI-SILENCING 1-like isoform X1 n=1 Tax=Iris pallida TaxID=29817 RepID=A0AAX6E0V0_IRIPA|nr:protein ANTI-SILENCING 1-like isoform X1 [Iris pallida]
MMEPDKSELQFQWGKKRGVGGAKKDTQFYESFTFDGEEYSLYDCVYLFKEGEDEPYIGKLLKVWDQDNRRKVKILWFFRPTDITNYLGDYVPMDKEIFLASGEGVGLFNINILESIGGKCSVICTSKDKRNPQPSKEAIESADYIFCCTFDVGTCTISDKISDKIAGVEVKFLLNQEEHDPSPISKAEASGLDGNGNIESGKYKAQADIPGDKPSKKIRLSSDTLKSSDDLEKNKNATDMKKVHIMHDEDGSGKGSVRPVKESSGKMKLSERNSKSLEADVNDGKSLKKMKLSSDSGKLSADLEKNKNAVSTRKVPILSHEDDSGKGSVRSIKESSGMMKLNEKNTKSLDESRMKDAAVSVKTMKHQSVEYWM